MSISPYEDIYDFDDFVDTTKGRQMIPGQTYIVDKYGNLVRKRNRSKVKAMNDAAKVNLPPVSVDQQFTRGPAMSGAVDIRATASHAGRAAATVVDGLRQQNDARRYGQGKPSSPCPYYDRNATHFDQKAIPTYVDSKPSRDVKAVAEPRGSPTAPMYNPQAPEPQAHITPAPPSGRHELNNQAYSRYRRRVKPINQEELDLDRLVPKPTAPQDTRQKMCASTDDDFINELDRDLESALQTQNRIDLLQEQIKNLDNECREFGTDKNRDTSADRVLGELLQDIDDMLDKDKTVDSVSKTKGDGSSYAAPKTEPRSRPRVNCRLQEMNNTTHTQTPTVPVRGQISDIISPVGDYIDDFDSDIREAIETEKRFSALNEQVKKLKNNCGQFNGSSNTGNIRRNILKEDTVDEFLNELDDMMNTPTHENKTTTCNTKVSTVTSTRNTPVVRQVTREPIKQWNGQTAKRGLGFKSKLKKEEPTVKSAVDDLIPDKIRRELKKRFG